MMFGLFFFWSFGFGGGGLLSWAGGSVLELVGRLLYERIYIISC